MRLALRELWRRPGRFSVAGGSLVVLTVLLLFLGGLLDGLYLGSTGVLRAQSAELIVFSSDARASLIRSRLDPDTRAQVADVEGVATVEGLGVALVGAEVPDETDLADVAVVGYQAQTGSIPAPPEAGQGYADRSLERAGVAVGDVLGVGLGREPIEVVGWIDDANYLLQGGLWVPADTWRTVLDASRPDATLPPGWFQAFAVTTADGADPTAVAAAVDEATGGATDTLSVDEAVLSLPGIREQNSTFSSIIGVTVFVAGLVVALFFALLTLERTGLYAVLKALGASSRQVFAGVVVQALVVAALSFGVGALVVAALAPRVEEGLPVFFEDAVPFQLEGGRVLTTFVLLLITAVVGSAVSIRRVVRVDPASAIG